LVTIGERLWHWKRLPKVTDYVLFALQCIAGIFLLYVTLVTGLFGIHWNWYLILFNPLPLILWLCCRKRNGYTKVYLWYACLLAVFIVSMPLVTTQSDTSHLLIAATFAIRCFNKYNKKQKINDMKINTLFKRAFLFVMLAASANGAFAGGSTLIIIQNVTLRLLQVKRKRICSHIKNYVTII
jgi:hypothetical protein